MFPSLCKIKKNVRVKLHTIQIPAVISCSLHSLPKYLAKCLNLLLLDSGTLEVKNDLSDITKGQIDLQTCWNYL